MITVVKWMLDYEQKESHAVAAAGTVCMALRLPRELGMQSVQMAELLSIFKAFMLNVTFLS